MSAVDPQVADFLFSQTICGVLKSKIVILVTHQLQFLRQCNKILVIKDGEQKALGDYNSIVNTGFDIEEILKQYNHQLKQN